MQPFSEISKTIAGMPPAALVALVVLAAFGLSAYAISAIVKVSKRGRAVAANLWVRLPSDWIDKHRLREFPWKHGGKRR